MCPKKRLDTLMLLQLKLYFYCSFLHIIATVVNDSRTNLWFVLESSGLKNILPFNILNMTNKKDEAFLRWNKHCTLYNLVKQRHAKKKKHPKGRSEIFELFLFILQCSRYVCLHPFRNFRKIFTIFILVLIPKCAWTVQPNMICLQAHLHKH